MKSPLERVSGNIVRALRGISADLQAISTNDDLFPTVRERLEAHAMKLRIAADVLEENLEDQEKLH